MVYKTLKTKGIPFKFKDGFGAGNSSTQDVVPNNVVADKDKDGNEIIFVKHGKGETYIPLKDNKKLAMNKIQHTRVGDDIHYYQNGVEGRGIVVKMSNEYVMVAKEDGNFEDIHINDTFFVKDIVVNKTWDMMDSGERTDVLTKAHAPSTRFITKDWHDLPRELREVLTKQSDAGGASGGNFSGEKSFKENEDETKTFRDQDKTLAANNPVADDEQAKGLHKVYDPAEFNKKQKLHTSGKKGKKCISCGKIHATKSDVEHGAYGAAGGSGGQAGVSTQEAFDITDDTGYEERPHICEDCVGKLPRSDAKDHGENEVKEDSKEHSLKEQFDKVKEKEKSEQFRKIYGGGKKRKKGVPEWNVNTWGLDYTVKEYEG